MFSFFFMNFNRETRLAPRGVLLGAAMLAIVSGCARDEVASAPAPNVETGGPLRLVIAGQALLKVDPRTISGEPFADVRPIVESADIAFTNFEMAVNPEDNSCGLREDYVVYLGQPRMSVEERPGNAAAPHAVSPSIMEFLADMNFRLMSLSNNHTWDLGPCGVEATIEAAERYGVAHAGTGATLAQATAPVYVATKGVNVALVASNTSRDPRDELISSVNGVWTGNAEDWNRNITAVREAAQQADFVIFYQHFQIFDAHFEGLGPRELTPEGHAYVESVSDWQTEFARAIIDAGASMYISHGHRGFDGIEIYNGRPILRQFGGLAYPAMKEIGAYDAEYAFWGLLGELTVEDGAVTHMEFTPLLLDEGEDLVGKVDHAEFLRRRGFPEIAKRETAQEILERFKTLSARYGADVRIDNERAIVEIASPAALEDTK